MSLARQGREEPASLAQDTAPGLVTVHGANPALLSGPAHFHLLQTSCDHQMLNFYSLSSLSFTDIFMTISIVSGQKKKKGNTIIYDPILFIRSLLNKGIFINSYFAVLFWNTRDTSKQGCTSAHDCMCCTELLPLLSSLLCVTFTPQPPALNHSL